MIQSIHSVQRAGLALVVAVGSVASCFGAESVVAPTLQFSKIAVILHFNATAAALNDVAHAKTPAGGVNPNRALVEKLLANGVEVWVCGQSVIRGGHALADVLPGIRIAHSAMIFNLNRQADDWATLAVH